MALKNIMCRRRNEAEVAMIQVEEDDNLGYVQLPNGILLDDARVQDLKSEQHHVTKKAYAIMEWWRCTGNNNMDTAIPRYEAFPAWGHLLKLIALCVPSSAAVERVFPNQSSVCQPREVIYYRMKLKHL